MTGIAVRKDVAMTGEITLRGRVLRIGGLKEKLLAAHRGGLRRVLIPKDNERELSEIPENITHVLEIIPVATVDEVLANALVSELSPIEWDEKAELEAAIAVSRVEEDEVPGVITH
jgi:ATP-dependent Lon protease